jgi:hypothetical protein
MDEYIRRYSQRDIEGVTDLCLAPFLAIREGAPIHMPDRDAVRDHFTAMIDAYRRGGATTWRRIETDTRELGEHSVFMTVRWNALDAHGNVLRDTRTTYHLLATPMAGVSSHTPITSRLGGAHEMRLEWASVHRIPPEPRRGS